MDKIANKNNGLTESEEADQHYYTEDLDCLNKFVTIFQVNYNEYYFDNKQHLSYSLSLKNNNIWNLLSNIFNKLNYYPYLHSQNNFLIYIPEEKSFIHVTDKSFKIYNCETLIKLRAYIFNLNVENLNILNLISKSTDIKPFLDKIDYISLDDKYRWLDIEYIDRLQTSLNFHPSGEKKTTADAEWLNKINNLKKLKIIKNNFETIILLKEALLKPIIGLENKDQMDIYSVISVNGGPNSPELIEYTEDFEDIEEIDLNKPR